MIIPLDPSDLFGGGAAGSIRHDPGIVEGVEARLNPNVGNHAIGKETL